MRKEFGIEGVDARKLNWAAVQERKAKIVPNMPRASSS